MHPTFVDILFWSCLALGGVYTLCTLFMGGLSHAVGHAGHIGDVLHLPHAGDVGGHHIGHIDAGHAGHVDAAHVGHADAAHVGHADGGHAAHADGAHGHGHADAQHHGGQHGELEEAAPRFNILSYMNPMSVAGFLVGFGGVGTIARVLGVHPAASALYAGAGGLGLWYAVYLFITRMFAAAGATSHNRREALVGLRATVTAPIAGQQPGMVCYIVGGTRQSIPAISDDEDVIPRGSLVRIHRVDSRTAYVSRMD